MFRLNKPEAAFRPGHPFPERECEHARPQLFADQARVTGKVDPRALALTTMPGVYSDYGTLSFGVTGVPYNRATEAHGVAGTFVAPDCSASLLTLATPVSLTGCEFGPVRFSRTNVMTRVIGAALLALRAVSCPERLGSHLSGALLFGTLQFSQPLPSKVPLEGLVVQVRFSHFSLRELQSFSARALLPNLCFFALRCCKVKMVT